LVTGARPQHQQPHITWGIHSTAQQSSAVAAVSQTCLWCCCLSVSYRMTHGVADVLAYCRRCARGGYHMRLPATYQAWHKTGWYVVCALELTWCQVAAEPQLSCCWQRGAAAWPCCCCWGQRSGQPFACLLGTSALQVAGNI
jgi:hypothetical protein